MLVPRRKLIWVALATVVTVCLYIVIVFSYWFYQKDNIYPGISVAGISVSQMSDEEAVNTLEKETENYKKSVISISGNKLNLEKLKLEYNVEETVRNSKEETNKNPFLLGFKEDYPLIYSYDKEYLYNFLYSLDKKYKKQPKNSTAKIANNKLVIADGKDGQQINYANTVYLFENSLMNLSSESNISLVKIPPTYSSEDLSNKIDDIESIFAGGLTLANGKTDIKVPLSEMVTWVQLNSKKESSAILFSGDILMLPLYSSQEDDNSLISTDLIENYLGSLSEKINTEPINAKLTMNGNKVAIFVDSKDGKNLDIQKTAVLIKEKLESNNHKVEIIFNTVKPDVYIGSLNELGIKELIATGYSNFSGSPANRRQNIRVGAEKFNGLLIKPGEIFSFTANLGEVDAKNGYLPELVIKDNETIPEYGGGLCQVSSTAFRAALNAGLPITARKAHSYPVTYYKPYGTDATIYVPNPDLKFKNDTEEHILIQTRIVGNYLYFDFYGTKKDTSVKFAGNKNATGAVSKVELVTPYTYDFGGRGEGSFKAIVYRFTYDKNGKQIDSEYFLSNYDSPDKYHN